MNDYIEAVCVGKPMDLPTWNEESEKYEVYFEESETPWNPYADRDIISYVCESADEACEIYNYYNQNPVGEKKDEETTN